LSWTALTGRGQKLLISPDAPGFSMRYNWQRGGRRFNAGQGGPANMQQEQFTQERIDTAPVQVSAMQSLNAAIAGSVA
jgi:hypothetical protein